MSVARTVTVSVLEKNSHGMVSSIRRRNYFSTIVQKDSADCACVVSTPEHSEAVYSIEKNADVVGSINWSWFDNASNHNKAKD